MQHPSSAAVLRPRSIPRVLALAAAASVALAACTGGGASPTVEPSERVASVPFEGTDWQLTEYVGKAGGVVSIPAAVEVTATFADATVAGSSGCNTYRGPYTIDGDAIEIGAIAATAMACAGAAAPVEEAYLQLLPLMTTVAVAGDTLELRNEAGTIVLRYQAVEPTELSGTKWVATGINNGTGAVSSVGGDAEVMAVFGSDGTVAGNGGCNTFNGPYTVDGSAIAIGPLMSTKMACPTLDQESAYLAALQAATTYAISGDKLELRDAEGALQVSFTATAP